jgi:hypothetical protein
MTKGEVEFIEDINNLQNYKPITVTQLEHDEISRFEENLITQCPNLSNWKPRKFSYRCPSPDTSQKLKINDAPFKLIKFDPLKSFGFFLNIKPRK